MHAKLSEQCLAHGTQSEPTYVIGTKPLVVQLLKKFFKNFISI